MECTRAHDFVNSNVNHKYSLKKRLINLKILSEGLYYKSLVGGHWSSPNNNTGTQLHMFSGYLLSGLCRRCSRGFISAHARLLCVFNKGLTN